MGVFHSNCTIPPEGTAAVASPSIRGTLEIIWGCFSLLLLSTWSILYLNVPPNSTPITDTQKYWRKSQRLFSKLKWMALNILAPEWPLAKAWSDHCSVSSFIKKFDPLRKERGEDDVPWTRAHVYLANIGGFGIKFEKIRVQTPVGDVPFVDIAHDAHEQTVTKQDSPQSGAQSTTNGVPEDQSQSGAQDTNIFQSSPGDVPDQGQGNHNLAAEIAPTSTPTSVSRASHAPNSENRSSEQTEGQIEMQESSTRTLSVTPRVVAFHSDIQDWVKQGRFAGNYTKKLIGKTSKRVGQIPWNLDSSNTKAVQTAAQNVTLDQFNTTAERHRFLVGRVVWFDNLHALQGDHWILDAHQLLLVRQMGIIDQLPALTEDDLEGKNRADALLSLLALSQIVWFTIQLIERLYYHRTTQLEIVTFAFSICAAIIFILVWNKPKDVQTTIFVDAVRYPTPRELTRIAVAGPYIFARKRGKRHSIWIPNNSIHWESASDEARDGPMKQFNLGCASALIIFGAVHCIAWDFTFPTLVEKRMWQVSSVLSATLVPLTVVLLVIYWRFAETKDGRSLKAKRGSSVIFLLLAAVFVFARLFIIVEAFRSLAYLPSGAFLTTWTNAWPHVG
jgi:hypothetical protein